MNIVFIGTVLFSKKALQQLIDIGFPPCCVITKQYSSFNADFAELAPVCEKYNIPYRFVDDIHESSNFLWIKEHNPDVIFCFGWSSLLKDSILKLPRLGVIGFHPAALPENRGRHPLIWALALGLKETASTFFFMDQGADSGDILSQETVSIDYKDDASSLYSKITEVALKQISSFTPKLKANSFVRKPQDHSLANTWRKRGKEDGRIDFRMSSRSIYNLVRALTRPYVGAHVQYRGQDVKVWKAKEIDVQMPNIEPGKVLSANQNELCVKCGHKAISLIEHEFDPLPEKGEYL